MSDRIDIEKVAAALPGLVAGGVVLGKIKAAAVGRRSVTLQHDEAADLIALVRTLAAGAKARPTDV